MSWDLQAYVELRDGQEPSELALAAIAASTEPLGFGRRVTVRGHQPDADYRTPPRFERELDMQDDLSELVRELATGIEGSLEFHFRVALDGGLLRPIHLWLFGSDFVDEVPTYKRFDAVVEFCNRGRWTGSEQIATGDPCDEAFLVRWLEAICDRATPKSLFVLPEEAVTVPTSYHLVYHSELSGYAQDVRDLAMLALHGWETDDGYSYEPLITAPRNSMLFSSLANQHVDRVQSILAGAKPLLQKILDGAPIPDDLIEETALRMEGVEFLNTRKGLGYFEPPFLKRFCWRLPLLIIQALEQSELDQELVVRSTVEDDPEVVAGHVELQPRGDQLVPSLLRFSVNDWNADVFELLERAVEEMGPQKLARVEHFRVVVNAEASLPKGHLVSEEGELWFEVDGSKEPPIWDRRLVAGKPIHLSRMRG